MLTKQAILHTAKLAKIKLNEKEIETFQTDLGNIFDFINELNEVDTSGIKPTSQVTGITNSMREDIVADCSYTNKLLKCTPHDVQDHQVKIPKIM